MEYQEALQIANRIKADLTPFCDRVEIAGSIRREKQTDIKDVEIVCIPKLHSVTDMFGETIDKRSVLEGSMPEIIASWNAWVVKGGEKYKQLVFPGGAKLDLFIVTPETWGVQFTLRTGPADYSHWLVTNKRFGGALPGVAQVKGGRVLVHGKPIATPEEEDFFAFLEIPMPHPRDRALTVKSYINLQSKDKTMNISIDLRIVLELAAVLLAFIAGFSTKSFRTRIISLGATIVVIGWVQALLITNGYKLTDDLRLQPCQYPEQEKHNAGEALQYLERNNGYSKLIKQSKS